MKIVLPNILPKSMATVVHHSNLRHLRGKIGGLVFKWYGDRLVVTQVPRRSKKKPSRKQQAGHNRFRLASKYAKKARKDPQLWAIYEAVAKKRRTPTRAVAISDYLSRPKFSFVSTEYFHGNPGEKISIVMKDRFPAKTIAMDMVLRNAKGGVLEHGPATGDGRGGWKYTTKKAISRTEPLTLEATATDRFAKTSRCAFTGLPGARQPLIS